MIITSATKLEKLKKKAKQAPTKPGVYFWLNNKKQVIYVGRANSLKQRLAQYFQKNLEPKTQEMVLAAKYLNYRPTDSILESIILESQEIKRYWPLYNIKDRDDKSFIYVLIEKTDYPRPRLIRGSDLKKIRHPQDKLFGPYQSYNLINSALKLLRPIFPYSLCQANNGRACFDYQIGLCPGSCLGKITPKDYQKNIKNLSLILNGKKQQLINRLKKENPLQAKALKHLQDVSLLSRETDLNLNLNLRIEAYDISHWQGKASFGAMTVWEQGGLNKNAYRLFKIKDAPASDDERSLLEVLIRRFNHYEWPVADLIVIDGGRPQISFLSKELKRQKIKINNLVGISKLAGDQLVFLSDTTNNKKNQIKSLKNTLLLLRDEAHRFANYGRARRQSKKFTNNQ